MKKLNFGKLFLALKMNISNDITLDAEGNLPNDHETTKSGPQQERKQHSANFRAIGGFFVLKRSQSSFRGNTLQRYDGYGLIRSSITPVVVSFITK